MPNLREPPAPTCGVTKAMALTAAVCDTCGCAAAAGRGAATKAQKPALHSSTAAVSRRERGAAIVAADPQKSMAPVSEKSQRRSGSPKRSTEFGRKAAEKWHGYLETPMKIMKQILEKFG